MIRNISSYIGGAPLEGESGGVVERFSPSTGKAMASVSIAGSAEIDRAVDVATEAQKRWNSIAPAARAESIWGWGDSIRAAIPELARLDAEDVGRLVSDSLRDIESSVKWTRYWAHATDGLRGDQVPSGRDHLMYTKREPIGVYGIITPWNAPSTTFVARVVAAIACGNSTVVKPSEFATRSAIRLVELAEEAGIPKGLINVISGDGSTGRTLTEHEGVGGISFTGSVPTGRAVGEAAGRTLKKSVLELGGKSPTIIFGDANLDEAIPASVWGVFANAGQICTAGTRLLVHESIAETVTAEIVRMASNVTVGDPFDEAAHIGPLAFGRQKDRVLEFVAGGVESGAKLEVGRHQVAGAGNFVAPVVFSQVSPDAAIAREEIFGPVLSIMTFADDDDAIRIANGVDYGLSATVWTKSLDRMLGLADALEVGAVYGNTPRTGDPALAFGGTKQSGVGSAYARGAIEGATREKSVAIRFGESPVMGWDDIR